VAGAPSVAAEAINSGGPATMRGRFTPVRKVIAAVIRSQAKSMPKRIRETSEDEEKGVVNIILSFCAQYRAYFRARRHLLAGVPCVYNGLTGIQVTTAGGCLSG
jgi:hypothetical protein